MFSEFFIHRPKFAFVVSIVMMLAGLICLSLMPVSEYPEVSPPTISVRMTYAGASAEELAQVVAAPVEEQLIGMDDLLYFSSSCSNIFTGCVIRDNLRPILSGSNNRPVASSTRGWQRQVEKYLGTYNEKLEQIGS